MKIGLRDFRVRFALDELRAFCIFVVMRFHSHREIIDTVWKSVSAYAMAIGVLDATARTHRLRDSIPSDYWQEVCADAQRLGFTEVTQELLQALKRPRKKSDRAMHSARIDAAA